MNSERKTSRQNELNTLWNWIHQVTEDPDAVTTWAYTVDCLGATLKPDEALLLLAGGLAIGAQAPEQRECMRDLASLAGQHIAVILAGQC